MQFCINQPLFINESEDYNEKTIYVTYSTNNFFSDVNAGVCPAGHAENYG